VIEMTIDYVRKPEWLKIKLNTNEQYTGAHMFGPHVTDMITEAGLARVLNATAMDIANTIHPHPTLAEAIGEAALAVNGKEIHA
jgi:pyruvate/2-oxoglutarate dehydrogenase complex dihydrolipoamide dehydrogenase (E3) component